MTRLLVFLLLAGLMPAQDQLVKKALSIIEKNEALEAELAQGDVASGNRYIGDLNRAVKYLNAAYKKDTVHWKDAAARHQALIDRINQKIGGGQPPKAEDDPGLDLRELQALERAVDKATHSMSLTRPDEFAVARVVQRFRENLIDFRVRLKDFPAASGSVIDVKKKIDLFEAKLKEGVDQAEARRVPEGAVERLAAIKAFYSHDRLTERLQEPLEPQAVEDWAKKLRFLRTERLPADIAWLDSMEGKIGLDFQAWQSIRGYVRSSLPRTLEDLALQSRDPIYGAERSALDIAKVLNALDPNNAAHRNNYILGEGNFERNMEQLRKGTKAIDVAEAYDRGMQTPDAPDRAAHRKLVQDAIDHMQACVVAALDSIRMPKAVVDDEKLLAIAADVFKQREYGSVKRMLVNAKLRTQQKTEGSVSHGTVSSTITVYEYDWDEFQVATAEKEGDGYWIYYTKLKFFRKGGSTTPIDRWIVADRFKSNPILEANIDK